MQGSSLVNSFYGGVSRPGLTLAGAALLGTGGEYYIFYNLFDVNRLYAGYLYLHSVNAVPSLEHVGKSLDTVGKTVVDTAKDKLVLPHSFTGEFVAIKKVDDGLPRLEVIHNIPGP